MSKTPSPPDGKKPAEAKNTFPWAKGPVDQRPIYRVVELVRDTDGRVRKRGNIWHVDLDVPRKFGRAMAANTASHRILIEDNQGRVLEEVPVTSAGERQSTWSSWQDIPLPKLPPSRPPARKLPVLAPPAPTPSSDAFREDDEAAATPAAAASPTVGHADDDCDVAL